MKMTARLLAVQALLHIEDTDGYSNLVLDGLLRDHTLPPREAAFATALFYGVLERRITLDVVLARYCRTPLHKLDPPVREVLRLSLYQLLYMDSVPDRAAISEGAELCRVLRKSSAAGLVNGTLRAFQRDGKPLFDPTVSLTEEERLSLHWSCPLWLVQELAHNYGMDVLPGILEASVGQPPLYLRTNTTRVSNGELVDCLAQEGVTAIPDPDLSGCLQVEGSVGDLTRLESYRRGLFHVQDKASQLCCLALDVHAGQRVLDVCAAPGGKTFTLAEQLEDRGEVLSCDLYEARVGLIRQGAQRLNLACVKPFQADAAQYDATLGLFDRVLCDVLCSGFGIIRRKPEIKYKDPQSLEELPDIQYKILETAAHYVDEGGTLLYSTCTLLPAENQQVVDRFLERHSDFEPLPLTALGREEASVTLLPAKDGSDGFFIAAMRKRG